MTNLTSLFLSQSYQDAWKDYKHSLSGVSQGGEWDYIILTASNEEQAAGFRAQLEARQGAGLLPLKTHFAVLPDRDGKRVGSGGATLGVIRYIAERTEGDFSGLRILVIHSGGDSKRVPQYSALGKLFSPVPHELPDGRNSTLFDELLIATASVPARIREGMLLLSGDVLLLYNPLQIDYSGSGAAAISFKENVETGKNHGVFLGGSDGNVRRFLHKQSTDSLRAVGAVNERNAVDIDTGAIVFSRAMLSSLFALISTDGKTDAVKYDALVNDTVRLSLYGDFLYPLATDSTLEEFYLEKPEGAFCEELTLARKQVWDALRPYRLSLLRLAPAKFVHFGTTREILALVNGGVKAYSDLGWRNHVGSSIPSDRTAGYGSVLSPYAKIGRDCYLEVSYVHRQAVIGNRVVLSHIDIHDETVPDNVVLHGLKQKDGKFVARIYGVEDNPKEPCFFGKPLSDFLTERGIPVSELWKSEDRTLWTAELYPVCDTIKDAVAAALNVYALLHGSGDLAAWQKAERKSLASGFLDADPAAIIAWNARMSELVQMDDLLDMIRKGIPAKEAKGWLGTGRLTPIQLKWLEKRLSNASFSQAMRLQYYIGVALGGVDGDKYIADCFRSIQNTILFEGTREIAYHENCRITGESHRVSLPLRVNWGGGWSDTPPYCLEKGGTVLNAAILLNGRHPVEVTLKRIDELKIVFDSRDMDIHGEFSRIEPLQKTGDPYDPFALQKACLLACGILPRRGGSLQQILKRLGGGFVMQSEVTDVPKGSGLGTSSILSAACAKAVLEFMGISCTEEELCDYVLCMEQIMSTGGGWQDQIGGLTSGIKYTTSRPGSRQVLKICHVQLDGDTLAELNRRFCLIYTGQRRLARNLLRDVIGSYVGNDPDSLYALNEIQKIAALMRFELERGNIDEFAALLNRHWELSKMIDKGSSNTLIEQIFESIEDLISGKMICGAGGGGFLQVILREGATKDDVRKRLKGIYQDNAVDVWDTALI